MKKLSKATALLAAGALLFGGAFLSCSSDGLPPELSGNSSNAGGNGGNGGNGGGAGGDGTSAYKWTFADLKNVACEGVVNSTKDAWPATAAALTSATVNATTFAATASGTITQFVLKSDVSYPSTGKTGLTMKVKSLDANGDPAFYNIWSDGAVSSNYTNVKNTASAGYIEGEREFLEIDEVEGPFKIEVIYGAGASSDKTDRYAFVNIGGTEYKDSSYPTSVPSKGSTLEASYSGSDKVKVLIGGVKTTGTRGLIRVHDVKITPLSNVVKATGVTVSAAATSVTINDTLQLTATVAPNDATSKTVKWESSDPTKASVDATGKVTGLVAAAKVTITATATDGSEKSDSIDLAVVAGTDKITPSSVTLATNGALDKDFTIELHSDSLNEDGITALAANEDVSSYITDSASGLTVSEAKVKTAATAAGFTVTIKGTAGASDTTGKLVITIPADLTNSDTQITLNIPYTITSTVTQTDASWDLTTLDSRWNSTNKEFKVSEDKKITSSSTTLTADFTSTNGGATLYLCKSSTEKGQTSSVLQPNNSSNATSVSATDKSAKGTVAYKSHSSYPVIIKFDAIKITGVKGKVKITVNAGKTGDSTYTPEDGTATTYSDRKIQILAGDTVAVDKSNYVEGEILKTAANYDLTADLGAEGTVYISATNETGIKKITIEPVQ